MSIEPRVRDEMITLDGLRFHYRDWGDPDAPPLVLLHAYLQHARTWDTIAKGLADHFRVLALDQRGFGESEWATDYHELRFVGDLAAFADALTLDRFSAVGFSMGGFAAGSYALLYPGRVERLVLAECLTAGDETEDVPWIHAMRAHHGQMRALPEVVATPQEAAAAFRPLAPYAAEDELRRWMEGGLEQGSDGRWTWRSDPVLRRPGPPGRIVAPTDVFRARLTGVTCPTLLLVGAESWMDEVAERTGAVVPAARTVTIPQAGHWVPLDNPRGFLEVVRCFLTEG